MASEDDLTLSKRQTWRSMLSNTFTRSKQSRNEPAEQQPTKPTFHSKTAVASLRMHFQRHKQKRSSLSNILSDPIFDCRPSEGPESFYTDYTESENSHKRNSTSTSSSKPHKPAPSDVPLPTSPIVISTTSVLTLDLGPPAFTSPTFISNLTDPDNFTTGCPKEFQILLTPETTASEVGYSTTPSTLLRPMEEACSAESTPMPGTTLSLEMEQPVPRSRGRGPISPTRPSHDSAESCVTVSVLGPEVERLTAAMSGLRAILAEYRLSESDSAGARKRNRLMAFGPPAIDRRILVPRARRAVKAVCCAETAKRARPNAWHPNTTDLRFQQECDPTHTPRTLNDEILSEMEPLSRQQAPDCESHGPVGIWHDRLRPWEEVTPPPSPTWLVDLPIRTKNEASNNNTRDSNDLTYAAEGQDPPVNVFDRAQILEALSEPLVAAVHSLQKHTTHEKHLTTDMSVDEPLFASKTRVAPTTDAMPPQEHLFTFARPRKPGNVTVSTPNPYQTASVPSGTTQQQMPLSETDALALLRCFHAIDINATDDLGLGMKDGTEMEPQHDSGDECDGSPHAGPLIPQAWESLMSEALTDIDAPLHPLGHDKEASDGSEDTLGTDCASTVAEKGSVELDRSEFSDPRDLSSENASADGLKHVNSQDCGQGVQHTSGMAEGRVGSPASFRKPCAYSRQRSLKKMRSTADSAVVLPGALMAEMFGEDCRCANRFSVLESE